MPASARNDRVVYATPGVGSGPINSASTPIERMPAEMAFSSMYPLRRVSLPTTILWRPCPLATGARDLNTCAAARPSFKAVSEVTGSTLATPRTPSVPNNFVAFPIRLRDLFYTPLRCAVNRVARANPHIHFHPMPLRQSFRKRQRGQLDALAKRRPPPCDVDGQRADTGHTSQQRLGPTFPDRLRFD